MGSYVGKWVLACKTPMMNMEGLWDVREEGGAYSSDFTAQGQTVPVTDIEIDGDKFKANSYFKMGPMKITTVMTAVLDQATDSVSGEFKSKMGPMKFTGKREDACE